MTPNEQKKAARDFVARWKAAEGNEQRESNSFWIELCQNVLGIANPTQHLDFERKVKGRRIDVFYEDRSILIENKSRGIDLDEPEQRGKDRRGNVRWVTPFEQAKWYADNITPRSVMPKWIITCNFDEIRIYDLDREDAETSYETITLDELPDQYHRLSFFTRKENSRLEREKQLSVKAGEVVGKLYDSFSKAYRDIENDEREQRSLNILITRIVFLLFAEDAELLHERDAFYKYLKNFQVNHMRQALIDLFSVLKTPKEERDPLHRPGPRGLPLRERRPLRGGHHHPAVRREHALHPFAGGVGRVRLERHQPHHLRRRVREHAEPRDAPRRWYALHEHREHPQTDRAALLRRAQGRTHRHRRRGHREGT